MKKLFYPLMLAIAFVATSCTNTEDSNTTVDPSGKTPISFSVEENNTPLTRAGFSNATRIAMRIKSTNGESIKYTRVAGLASSQANGYSSVTLDDDRYWDDAFGRQANLSVYAIAVPDVYDSNSTELISKLANSGSATWFTESPENEIISWDVATEQDASTLKAQDLTYSNNISEKGKKGVCSYDFNNGKYPEYDKDLTYFTNGCMKFNQAANAKDTDPGKFDKGHLIFNHALSRITVNLVKSDGFSENSSFTFTSAIGNVNILGVPVEGKLNLTNGEWGEVKTGTISKMSVQSSSANKHSLMAQMLPGFEIKKAGSTANMLSFEIDNNLYYVTQAQMYDALNNAPAAEKAKITIGTNSIVMQQGINYIFNINVKKTGVVVTATVADFNKVTAEDVNPSNARIHLNLLPGSGTPSTDGTFKIVRALEESPTVSDNFDGTNWQGDYKETATLTANGSSWNTDWYFDSNKAYYHFRLVNKESTIEGANDKDVVDYFKISSGSTDFHWGAPMDNTKGDVVYNVESGYENNLYQAIGATTDAIGIVDLHVMSKIVVVLQSSGDGAVDLTGSTVKLTKVVEDGTVLVGTGKVIPSSSTSSIVVELPIDMSGFYVVPQSLVRGTAPSKEYVGLTIVTGDGNKYIIDNLSTIKATSVDNEKNQTKGTEITRWYPGHEYTYTFNLKKTGIGSITCTVVGWNEVKAKPTDISLES